MTKINGTTVQAIIDAQYIKHYSKFDKACLILVVLLTTYMSIR